jgi:predicted ATPase
VRLLERDVEVGRLSAALAGGRAGRGSVVVVEGAAGLGKTALLRHASGAASGMLVLTASGSELEHEFAFGVVRQLFERAPADLVGILEAGGDRFAALHGLYWLVANLADERPVLLLVDDAQWADDPSLRFLAFLARRVRELPVAVLIAARPPLPGEDRTVLDTIAASAATLSPAPLTKAAIAALAGPDADPAFVGAVHRATAGNALLVGELLATSDGSLNLRASDPSLARLVALRLGGLGAAAASLAEAVAVLGDGAELVVAARVAGVG